MSGEGRVRAFLATSLDGFLAGEGGDLSWLPQPTADGAPGGDDGGFGAFLGDVGALLMGRVTYDFVAGYEGPWPYGDRPVLVATRRPLVAKVPGVRAVCGPIEALIAEARAAAGARDVYVDGGDLVRQAIDAGLLDELTLTLVPVALGRGVPLLAGLRERRAMSLVRTTVVMGGLVQATYRLA